MSGHDQPFRFLTRDEFVVLTLNEKIAYLTLATERAANRPLAPLFARRDEPEPQPPG